MDTYAKVVDGDARLAATIAHVDAAEALFGGDVKVDDEVGLLPAMVNK